MTQQFEIRALHGFNSFNRKKYLLEKKLLNAKLVKIYLGSKNFYKVNKSLIGFE